MTTSDRDPTLETTMLDENGHPIPNAGLSRGWRTRALAAEARVTALEAALGYIAAPTCGFPGVMASTPDVEVDAFIRNDASESNVRAALATCVGAARAALAPQAPETPE